VRFAFDEQQLEFRSQLRSFADKQCPPAAVRASWDSELGWSPQRWRELGELGVTGVTIPEGHGGLGLGAVDVVLLLEEAGYSALPEPLLDAFVGTHVLGRLTPDHSLARDLLPKVALGEATIAVASPEQPDLVMAGTTVALTWRQDDKTGGWNLKTAPLADQPAMSTVDGARRLAFLDLEHSETLSGMEDSSTLRIDAFDRGALGAAAVLVGAADRMIAMAAEYAGQRVQFGKAIGSFQAVKHHLADALVRVEFAKPLVYRAAWSLDQDDPEAGRHCSMAKSAASDAAMLAARVALQVHGAIGYTWEHDLHLWMKKAWSLGSLWGDAGWHRARLLGLVDW
jgi:alkylation response protein AidB-like acyl-CoA dehydrogenase